MKTIYIVRHGECEENLKPVFAGDCESPLTDLGKEQAHNFAHKISNELGEIAPTAFISSPLSRAVNTAKVAMETIEGKDGVEYYFAPDMAAGFKNEDYFYTVSDLLRPRNYGEIKGRAYHDPELGFTDEEIDELRFGFKAIVPIKGLDDAETMQKRSDEFAKRLLETMDDGDVVVVSCHKSTGKFLVHALTGQDDYLNLFHENCSYEKVELAG